jgi:SARP family transcriptional regulator, regulator of embCAB operon
MAGTTIQLCGRYIAELRGERVEARLPGRQGRMLFAYLVLSREQAASRDELVEAVWPTALPRDPQDALAAVVSKVRSALPEGWLDGRSRLQLLLPADARIDVERARAAVHDAESARALGDWPRTWSSAIAAQLVSERRLLDAMEAPWIDERRRELDDIRLRALECYATACIHLSGTELGGAERAARRLVQLAPLRESGTVVLMQVLEARGNSAEALLAYDAIRQRLRDELGVAPAAPLQEAHRRLLR